MTTVLKSGARQASAPDMQVLESFCGGGVPDALLGWQAQAFGLLYYDSVLRALSARVLAGQRPRAARPAMTPRQRKLVAEILRDERFLDGERRAQLSDYCAEVSRVESILARNCKYIR